MGPMRGWGLAACVHYAHIQKQALKASNTPPSDDNGSKPIFALWSLCGFDVYVILYIYR